MKTGIIPFRTILVGAPEAQLVKRWPRNIVVYGSSPSEGGNFLIVKGVPTRTVLFIITHLWSWAEVFLEEVDGQGGRTL